MDSPDLPSSPRKKLKMEQGHISNGTMGLETTTIDALALQQEHHESQLSKEAEVGITEFVSPDLLGFTGILKKRYTDFLVNEILPSGQVVHLDNLKAPKYGNTTGQSTQTETTSPVHVKKPTPTSQDYQPEAISELKPTPQSEHASQHESATLYEPAPRSEPILQPDSVLQSEPVSRSEAPTQSEVAPEPETAPRPVSTELEPAHKDITNAPGNGASEPSKIPPADALANWQSYANKPQGFQLTSENASLLNSFFDAEVVKSILALFNRVVNSPHRKVKDYGTIRSGKITDRELRTTIHQAIRRIFSSRLESFTDSDGFLLITAAVEQNSWGSRANGGRQGNSSGRGGRNNGNRNDSGQQNHFKGRIGWKELGGDYLHFTLYKENKDTMEVVSFLARQLKVQPRAFQFAGTKDRRAVTVQRVSVYRIQADRMQQVGRTLRQAKIGNYEYSPHGLELGELTGNEFTITLRDCQFQDATAGDTENRVMVASKIVESAAEHLSKKGFINYYGLQRFGTFSTRTDTVGVKMLQGDFKGAVEAILEYSEASLAAAQDPDAGKDRVSSDDRFRAQALHAFKTSGRSYPALDDLPRKFSAEGSLIRHLGGQGRGNDYLGALQAIPRNLRLMYVHAYQSLVWNVAASERWRRHGDLVLAGDLVLVDEHKEKVEETGGTEDIDADGEVIVQPASDDSAVNLEDRFARARALSQEEAQSGKYTIFDIVLPTPGYDVLYPGNELADFYKTFMASEPGGGLDPHDMRRQWKDVSLSGSYRKLIVKPYQDITFEVRSYTHDDEQFVETDVDRIEKRSRDTSEHAEGHNVVEKDQQKDDAVTRQEMDEMGEVKKLAVILKLQLESSQYATMALRELMKLGGVKTYKPDFGGGR